LNDQWAGGLNGVLVGGTMGLMQLQTEATYRQMVDVSVHHGRGAGELLMGVGDTGLARTLERIALVNRSASVDGVVVVTPFLWKFGHGELVDYFCRIADASRYPVYLYDQPALTGSKLSTETVVAAAEHKNVHGIKCSADPAWARQLASAVPVGFRVIVAQADLVNELLRDGVNELLDGIFSVAPAWVRAIGDAARAGRWDDAARCQRRLSELLSIVKRYGVFQSMTTLLNARGIPGKFGPAPVAPITAAAAAQLLGEPIVQDLLSSQPPAREVSTQVVAGAPRFSTRLSR